MKSDKDDLRELANSVRAIGRAITPPDVAAGQDACGEHVDSLTEAVMGVTAGLVKVADALDGIAKAIREAQP